MPPKKEITRDFILNKAFELTRLNGFESISARSLASELRCSTQPIYREFGDMRKLKIKTAELAWDKLKEYVQKEEQPGVPRELSVVLSYIRYALQESKLFQLLIESGVLFAGAAAEPLLASRPLDPKMIIFANGIIMMTAFNTMDSSWETIRSLTTDAYDAFRKAGGEE